MNTSQSIMQPIWLQRTLPAWSIGCEKNKQTLRAPRQASNFRSRLSADLPYENCLLVVKERNADSNVAPSALQNVVNAIEKSRWLLTLEDDWDGEGSVRYSETTWRRAKDFLLKSAVALWKERGVAVNAPAIHNGPEGSIDVYWETDNRSLLINIPADLNAPATFYGHGIQCTEVKGTLNPDEKNEWLLMWQMG